MCPEANWTVNGVRWIKAKTTAKECGELFAVPAHLQLKTVSAKYCYCFDGVRLAATGPLVHSPDRTWVNMEQRWDSTDRGNSSTARRFCHFVRHKSFTNWPTYDLRGERLPTVGEETTHSYFISVFLPLILLLGDRNRLLIMYKAVWDHPCCRLATV
jgi:hypothetical protein